MSLEKEWLGYVGEVVGAKEMYVDTRKTVLYNDTPAFEKTVRNTKQVVTWVEAQKDGEILDVKTINR